ncbi:sensor domain-containing diguanylate cyclase [bacterium]|nr:sensor domain-containing diguanylate cyclase [bacterium]MCI0605381.1 sensor domain-containing diguanylate cyclase [bacterium]
MIRSLLILFFAGVVLSVYFLIYPEYSAVERLIFAVTVLLYAVLSVISFGLRPNDHRVRVFVAVSVFVAFTFVFYQFPPKGAQTLGQLLYTFLHSAVFMLMSALLLHMSSLLPEEKPVAGHYPSIIRNTYLAAIALAIFATFIYANIDGRWIAAFPSSITESRRFVRILVLGFYGYATLGGSMLVAHAGYLSTSLSAKRQAIAVCAGLMPYGLFRFSAAVAPRLMNLPLYSTLETLVIFLLPVGFFLAIHGFQMFGVNVHLRRGILLAVTLALLVSAGYIIVLSAQLLFPNAVNSLWGFTVVCLVLGVILWPVIRNMSSLIDTLFFPERMVSRKLTKEIVERVAEYTDIYVLCKVFTDHIAEGMGSNSVAIYVVNEDGSSFHLAGSAGDQPKLTHIDSVDANRAIAEGGMADSNGCYDHVLGISFRDRTNALLCLGKKKTGERLSRAELEELRLASLQVSAMIENARLFALATRDSLTGLFRRAVFDERLASEASRSVREKKAFSVLMVDIDNFKSINDTYGHHAGDQVLRAVAGAIRDNSRKIDTVARYGGEEFAVLLPVTDCAGAVVVAEKMRSAIAELKIPVQDRILQTTVSMGAATSWDGILTAELVSKADDALYKAKRAGKNRVETNS